MNKDGWMHKSRRDLKRHIVVLLILILVHGVLVAQVESGKVVGSIRDASGAVLAGARVTVTNTDTNLSRSAVATNSGEYVVTELKPGTYTLVAEHEGFKKAVQAAVTLDVNQVVRVDFVLAVGSINETVTVTAAFVPLIHFCHLCPTQQRFTEIFPIFWPAPALPKSMTR
jgi:hypothetical protein